MSTADEDKPTGVNEQDVKKAINELDARPIETFPLFMSDLPENAASNVPLQAIQALLYEGTPSEQALNFKHQGNECFALGTAGCADALQFYTRGLEVGCGDASIEATLYLNRAAVYLGLTRWGEVLKDARQALRLDEERSFVKAHKRILRAALGLKKPSEARASLQALQGRGETVGASVEEELSRLEAEVAQYNAAQREKEAFLERIRKTVDRCDVEVVEGVEAHLKDHFGPDVSQQLIGPDALPTVCRDPRSKRRLWPVLLLYPASAQSDFLTTVDEASTMREILQLVFEEAAPWDAERMYHKNVPKLRVFWHDHREGQRLIEISHSRCIGDLLGSVVKSIERGILSFYVVPPGAQANELLRRFHHNSVGSF